MTALPTTSVNCRFRLTVSATMLIFCPKQHNLLLHSETRHTKITVRINIAGCKSFPDQSLSVFSLLAQWGFDPQFGYMEKHFAVKTAKWWSMLSRGLCRLHPSEIQTWMEVALSKMDCPKSWPCCDWDFGPETSWAPVQSELYKLYNARWVLHKDMTASSY